MIKRLISGQINSITIAAGLVAFSSLLSRLLGIFRDRILAGEFGASNTLDVYYAAFRIPDFIYNLLILGALSAGFIPIFTSLLAKNPQAETEEPADGNKKAWNFVSNILNIMSVSLVAISALGIMLAPFIIKAITPGFSPENQRLTSELARIMFFSPLFLGISGIIGGVLQSFKRFFVYSLAPIFYNIGIITGALYLVPAFGIYGLAWGVVLGAFLHMLVQIPTLISLGYRYSLKFDFKNDLIKKIGTMMVPRTLSLATTQINLLVITIVASTLASGSLAIFNFANNLMIFPVGIFGISYAVAAFPTFSSLAFDKKKLIESFSMTARQVLFFIIPSTVLLYTLRAQIIRVILGVGKFDWDATVLTINTLGYFSISLFAQALVPLLVRVFYARHDSKTPFLIGLFTGGLNVLLSYWLGHKLGVAGLGLAFSISTMIYFLILWASLRAEIGKLDEAKIFISSLKFIAAAVIGGTAVQAMKLVVWPYINMTKTLGVFVQGFAAGTVGILAYLLIAYFLKSEELFNFIDGIKRRMQWRKTEAQDQGEARGI